MVKPQACKGTFWQQATPAHIWPQTTVRGWGCLLFLERGKPERPGKKTLMEQKRTNVQLNSHNFLYFLWPAGNRTLVPNHVTNGLIRLVAAKWSRASSWVIRVWVSDTFNYNCVSSPRSKWVPMRVRDCWCECRCCILQRSWYGFRCLRLHEYG